MHTWSGIIDKVLHPHQKKQEKLMSRMVEYRELSSLALESESEIMYSLLQRELNEMFCEYLTCAFLDGIGFLIPHVALMWLINLFFPYLSLPLALPWVGSRLYTIVWYPPIVLMFYLARRLWRKSTGTLQVSPLAREG